MERPSREEELLDALVGIERQSRSRWKRIPNVWLRAVNREAKQALEYNEWSKKKWPDA